MRHSAKGLPEFVKSATVNAALRFLHIYTLICRSDLVKFSDFIAIRDYLGRGQAFSEVGFSAQPAVGNLRRDTRFLRRQYSAKVLHEH